MTTPSDLDARLLFGAAFYDEYRVTGSLDRDLDLMAQAGFSVIRVGESVWSTWEPEPGRFALDWLEPVLDGARARGIDVVLGTPTYAVPQWLQRLHPEIAAEHATGRRVPWGGRQEIDYTHPAFREHAERICRKVVARYADHPAVIGFQVDNEPGLHVLHNRTAFEGFVAYLRERYGTVEELNRAWGLVYWSHLLRDWEDLWLPDGNSFPQYDLEWRRYQAFVVNDFIAWEADIVREHARPEQWVTTCISYERPAIEDVGLARGLDVTSGNAYYKMQEALRIGVEVPRPEIWWTSGVWGLFGQGDRMFSSAQAPFLVTETNAQSIGQSHWENHAPYPGQIALAAFALISRGARMIEYWQWQTLHAGIETYWGGVLPHSGEPGRIYREVAALGARIREIEPDLAGYEPDSDVAFVYSTDTKRAFEFYPPLADAEGGPDRNSYLRIFDAFYRSAFERGLQSRIVHMTQLADLEPATLVALHPVLVVPSLYVADDADLALLVEYARAGGHLVVGIRTGYGDELARARAEVAPGPLAEAAGIRYEEYASLDAPVRVAGAGGDDAGAGTAWADLLELDGAEALLTYGSGIYAGQPAVTTHAFGEGRVTYVGTVPDRALAAEVLGRACPSGVSADWEADVTVTVASGTTATARVWFVSNWSPDPAGFTVPREMTRGGDAVGARARVDLAAWTCTVLVEPLDGQ
ncbi:beta-galactosidase [Demequina mangrovi]|uniref:Beta-galactosidase n=1 Tax=Demequina mangrovi TaxID=1043493 RepID=A0A1H6ZZP6_9MICO|nr:beta-galactosidase [Demequina mangrovi]SEJ58913.1 beta-galactosidase [Demequina mangrovi]